MAWSPCQGCRGSCPHFTSEEAEAQANRFTQNPLGNQRHSYVLRLVGSLSIAESCREPNTPLNLAEQKGLCDLHM